MSSAEHQPGEVIAGRCRIERRLGGGGRGGTYLAELSSTGQKVALERITLRPQQRTSELEAALEAEAHLLAGVDHPKVGRYVASFFDEGKTSFYLAELYVEGESLEERIYRGEPCTEGFLRRVADDLLGVLEILHRGEPAVVHGELHPGAVIEGDHERLTLVHFSGPRRLADEPSAAKDSTVLLGRYGLVAPELARGPLVPSADLFGLGVTLAALAMGRTPTRFVQSREREPSRRIPGVSEGFSAWILRMLELDPEARFAGAREARLALARAPAAKRPTLSRVPRAVSYAVIGLATAGALGVGYRLGAFDALLGDKPAAEARPPELPARPRAAFFEEAPVTIKRFVAHSGPVLELEATSDGSRAVTRGEDGTARLAELATGAVQPLDLKGSRAVDVAASPDGTKVAVAAGASLHCFGASDSAPGKHLATHDLGEPLRAIVFVDAARVAAAGASGKVRVIALDTGLASELGALPSAPTTLVSSGREVLALLADGSVHALSAEAPPKKTRGPSPSTLAARAPETGALALGGAGGAVRVLAPDGAEGPALASGEAITSLVLPARGERLVTGSRSGRIRITRASDGKVLHTFLDEEGGTTALGSTPDGHRLVSGHTFGVVKVWRMPEADVPTPIVRRADVAWKAKTPAGATPAPLELYLDGRHAVVVAGGDKTRLTPVVSLVERLKTHPEAGGWLELLRAELELERGRLRGDEFEREATRRADDALELASKARGGSELAARVALVRARVLLARGELAAARSAAQEARREARVEHEAMALLTHVALREKKPAECEALAREVAARASEPDTIAEALLAMRVLYMEQSRYRAAELVLGWAADLVPDDPLLRAAYARLLVRVGRAGDGLAHARRAAAASKHPTVVEVLGEALAARGASLLWDEQRPDEAKKVLDEAASVDARSADARYGLGAYHRQVAVREGSLEAAQQSERELRAALELDEHHALAKAALGEHPRVVAALRRAKAR